MAIKEQLDQLVRKHGQKSFEFHNVGTIHKATWEIESKEPVIDDKGKRCAHSDCTANATMKKPVECMSISRLCLL